MGYFPNGDAGDFYQEQFCERCVHGQGAMCPVWLLHLTHNRAECNKPNSFLHVLIPRDGAHNEQCRMFVEARRIDAAGRDVTDLPGLWDESDRMEAP